MSASGAPPTKLTSILYAWHMCNLFDGIRGKSYPNPWPVRARAQAEGLADLEEQQLREMEEHVKAKAESAGLIPRVVTRS